MVTPSLSVVIVRFAGGDAVKATLAALAPQRTDENPEVIVAHRVGEGASDDLRSRFPWVRWVSGDPGASPARLRTLGVRATTGALVACTEDHCMPAPDWCARIAEAHRDGEAVVGGAIDKAPSHDGGAWAAYLLDFARYMSPLRRGPASYASDCNVSYRRESLERVAHRWKDEFHETTVHWALQAAGVPLRLEPGIVVFQHRVISMQEWLPERRAHGKVFAMTRVAGASRLRSVLLALSTYLLPLVSVGRVVQRLRARDMLGRVPRSAWRPLLRAALAWSGGEREGYLRGAR